MIGCLAAGVKLIQFETKFCFFVRDDPARERQDGVHEVHQNADVIFGSGGNDEVKERCKLTFF